MDDKLLQELKVNLKYIDYIRNNHYYMIENDISNGVNEVLTFIIDTWNTHKFHTFNIDSITFIQYTVAAYNSFRILGHIFNNKTYTNEFIDILDISIVAMSNIINDLVKHNKIISNIYDLVMRYIKLINDILYNKIMKPSKINNNCYDVVVYCK